MRICIHEGLHVTHITYTKFLSRKRFAFSRSPQIFRDVDFKICLHNCEGTTIIENSTTVLKKSALDYSPIYFYKRCQAY